MNRFISLFLVILFVTQINAFDIINNTAGPITIGNTSFRDGNITETTTKVLRAGEKKPIGEFFHLVVYISGWVGETYQLIGFNHELESLSFVELDGKIIIVEDEKRGIGRILERGSSNCPIEIWISERSTDQIFKDYLRRKFVKRRSIIGSFDKEIDRDYNYGLKLGYFALKIAHKKTFPDNSGIICEQLIKGVKAIVNEFLADEQRNIKLTNPCNTTAFENRYHKCFLGFHSVYEDDQILEKSLEGMGCPKERVKQVIDSGNCEKYLSLVWGTAITPLFNRSANYVNSLSTIAEN